MPNVVQMRDLLIWQRVTMFHAADVVHAMLHLLHQVATGPVSHGTMTPAAPSTLCHCGGHLHTLSPVTTLHPAQHPALVYSSQQ